MFEDHHEDTLSCRLSIRHRSGSLDISKTSDSEKGFNFYSSSGSSISLTDLSTSNTSISTYHLENLGRNYAHRYRKAFEKLKDGRVSLGAAIEATLNFTNSILGAGLMGIPYAFRQAGMIPGCLLLVSVGLISDWSVGLMVTSGKRVGARSYQELMRKTFGQPGSLLCALFQVTFAIGCT